MKFKITVVSVNITDYLSACGYKFYCGFKSDTKLSANEAFSLLDCLIDDPHYKSVKDLENNFPVKNFSMLLNAKFPWGIVVFLVKRIS